MKKSFKRILSLALMTAMLATAAIGAIPVSADDYDNTLTLTINGTDCSTSGKNIVLYPNESDSVRKINTSEYYFRYSKILIFDGNGKLIEIGENMFADSPNETGSAQHNIYVPANGFAIAFSSGVSALNDCYNVAKEGAVFYNSTISVIYEVYGSYSGNTLTIKYDNPKAESATAKKFLFVGNSATYFNGTPIKFKGLAQSAGIDVDVTYCTYGSSYLHQYANAGHDYGKGLRKVLNNEQFDYVVLQDAGGAEYEDTKPAVSTLLPLIEANGAEALLYMRYSASSTPAYRFDGARTHYINYTRLSREYGLIAAPAASAFLICTDKYPEINLYADDHSHHSKEGSYLIACVMLMTYLGVDPVGVEYDAQLGSDVAKKLQECAKQACVDGYDYGVSEDELAPSENGYYVDGTKYESVTVNKPYTSDGGIYTDDQGRWNEHDANGNIIGKYTDGLFADFNGASNAIGCHKGAKVNIDIDLQGTYDIKAFKTQLFGRPGWGIPDPLDSEKNIYVEFSYSKDGKSYTSLGKAKATASIADEGWTKCVYTLLPDTKIEAKYIRATVYNANFVWCDEISAYGVDASNLALNKEYTLSGVGERNGSYRAKLTDGVAGDKLTYDKDEASTWFGFYNNNDAPDTNAPGKLGTVTFDFEKLHSIRKVKVHTLFGDTSGIKSPQYISVEVSDDGKTFTEVAKQTYTPSSTTDIKWADLTLEKPATGRYVRICVKLDSTFAFINEIEVYGDAIESNDDDDIMVGDVNGDSEIDKFDYIAVKRAVMGTLTLTDAQQKAADINGKDGVEKYDYVLVKRHVMGTYTIGE